MGTLSCSVRVARYRTCICKVGPRAREAARERKGARGGRRAGALSLVSASLSRSPARADPHGARGHSCLLSLSPVCARPPPPSQRSPLHRPESRSVCARPRVPRSACVRPPRSSCGPAGARPPWHAEAALRLRGRRVPLWDSRCGRSTFGRCAPGGRGLGRARDGREDEGAVAAAEGRWAICRSSRRSRRHERGEEPRLQEDNDDGGSPRAPPF